MIFTVFPVQFLLLAACALHARWAVPSAQDSTAGIIWAKCLLPTNLPAELASDYSAISVPTSLNTSATFFKI